MGRAPSRIRREGGRGRGHHGTPPTWTTGEAGDDGDRRHRERPQAGEQEAGAGVGRRPVQGKVGGRPAAEGREGRAAGDGCRGDGNDNWRRGGKRRRLQGRGVAAAGKNIVS